MKKLKTDPPIIAEYKTKVALVAAILFTSEVPYTAWQDAIADAMLFINDVDAAVDADLADTPAKAGL
jgi:hypothetical protein